MARAIFTTPNTIDFTADKFSGNRIHVFLPVTRKNVYYVRRLIRRYARKGYHVHASVNNNGRVFSNVFGSDIYAQATKREQAANDLKIILDHMREYDQQIDWAIAYCDKSSFYRHTAQHNALWDVLVKVDPKAAANYRNSDDVKERAERIHDARRANYWF